MLIRSTTKKFYSYWSYCVSAFLCLTCLVSCSMYVLSVTFLCCLYNWPFGCCASTWVKKNWMELLFRTGL